MGSRRQRHAALGLLNELLCTDVPIVAAPCVKAVLHERPAYADSVARG